MEIFLKYIIVSFLIIAALSLSVFIKLNNIGFPFCCSIIIGVIEWFGVGHIIDNES